GRRAPPRAAKAGDRRFGLEGRALVGWCAAVFLLGAGAACLALRLLPPRAQAAGAGRAEE
ncbi:unnamed protein product, partial [Prorocentrum cordatum]